MNRSEPQNPYAPTSEIRVAPESISFDGSVTEEHYRTLLPRQETRLFAALAILLFAIVLPVLIAAFLFAVFSGNPQGIVGSTCMTSASIVGLLFCIRMASSRTKSRSYLRRFPDLLGPMRGTFNSNGLVLVDDEKTHWLPWAQLAHMVVSNSGVRVPLGDDPRRFLALADELFDGFRPSDLEQMLARYRVTQTTYDQLALESAKVFRKDIGAPSYFRGWFNQPAKWSTWITWLVGPATLCLFIVYRFLEGEWDLVRMVLVVAALIGTLSSVRPLVQLIRNRGRTSVMCWGWLSETELIYGYGVHAMKVPIASLKYIGRDGQVLQFVLSRGTNLYVFRSLFQDASYFDNVDASFDRLNKVPS